MNFFAGPPEGRSGVRFTVKDLNNDGRADLLVGATPGQQPTLTTYLGKDITPGSTPSSSAEQTIFESGFLGGVFVG